MFPSPRVKTLAVSTTPAILWQLLFAVFQWKFRCRESLQKSRHNFSWSHLTSARWLRIVNVAAVVLRWTSSGNFVNTSRGWMCVNIHVFCSIFCPEPFLQIISIQLEISDSKFNEIQMMITHWKETWEKFNSTLKWWQLRVDNLWLFELQRRVSTFKVETAGTA